MPQTLSLDELYGVTPQIDTQKIDFSEVSSGTTFNASPKDYPILFNSDNVPFLDYRSDPNYELEKASELRQGTVEASLKGLSGRVLSIVPKFLAGAGSIGGLIFSDQEGLGKMYNNDFVNAMHEWDKSMYDGWFKVYANPDEYNSSLWDKLGTAKFWANDFGDGLAYLASAYAGGMSVGGLAGKFAQFAGATSMGTRIGSTGASMVYNIASEASMEANETYKSVKDMKYQQLLNIYAEQGMDYTTASNMAENESKEFAGKAASESFLFNAAILAPTAFWESRIFFGDPTRVATKTWEKFKKGALSLDDYTQMSKVAKQYLRNIGTGVALEGAWEENLQTAMQNYQMRSAAGFNTQLTNEIVRNFTGENPDGPTSIFIGALLGAGGGIAQSYRDITNMREDLTKFQSHKENLLENLKNRINILPEQYSAFMEMETITSTDEKGQQVEKSVPKLNQEGKIVYNTEAIVNKLMELQFDNELYAQRELASLKQDEVAGKFLDSQLLGRKLYSYLSSDTFADKEQAVQQFIKDLDERASRVESSNENEVTKAEIGSRLSNLKRLALEIYQNYDKHSKNFINFKGIEDKEFGDFLQTLNKGVFAESVHQFGLQESKNQLYKNLAEEQASATPNQTRISKIEQSIKDVDNLISVSDKTIAAITDPKKQRELYKEDKANSQELADLKNRMDALTEKAKDNTITEEEKTEMTELFYKRAELEYLYGSIHGMPTEKSVVEDDGKGNAVVNKKMDVAWRHKNFLSALAYDYLQPDIETDEKLSRGRVDLANVEQAKQILDTQNLVDHLETDHNTSLQEFKNTVIENNTLVAEIKTLQEDYHKIDKNNTVALEEAFSKITALKTQVDSNYQKAFNLYMSLHRLLQSKIETFKNISSNKYATDYQMVILLKEIENLKKSIEELSEFASNEFKSVIEEYEKNKEELKVTLDEYFKNPESTIVKLILDSLYKNASQSPESMRDVAYIDEGIDLEDEVLLLDVNRTVVVPYQLGKESSPEFYQEKFDTAVAIQALYNYLFGIPKVQIDTLSDIQNNVLEESIKNGDIRGLYNILTKENSEVTSLIDNIISSSQEVDSFKELLKMVTSLQNNASVLYKDTKDFKSTIQNNPTFKYFSELANLSREQRVELLKDKFFTDQYTALINLSDEFDPALHSEEEIKIAINQISDINALDNALSKLEDALLIAQKQFPNYVSAIEKALFIFNEIRPQVVENLNKREKIQDEIYKDRQKNLFETLGITITPEGYTTDPTNVIMQFLRTNTTNIDEAIEEVSKKGFPIGGFEYLLSGVTDPDKKKELLKLVENNITSLKKEINTTINSNKQIPSNWDSGLVFDNVLFNAQLALSFFVNRAFSDLRKSVTLNPDLTLNDQDKEGWFSSALYHYRQHLSMDRLLADLNNGVDTGIEGVTPEFLIDIINKFKQFNYLDTIKRIVESPTFKYPNTLELLNSSNKLKISPNKQQQIVLNQMELWDNSNSYFGYLRGIAGTGKSLITSYFFDKKEKDTLFATAFGDLATNNINNLLGQTNKTNIIDLLNDPVQLANIADNYNYLIIDEFDGLTFSSIEKLFGFVYRANENRKSQNKAPLKVFLLGDPTQFREYDPSTRVVDTSSSLEILAMMMSTKLDKNPNPVFLTDSLMVPYRSNFGIISDVSSKFRDNINKVEKVRVENSGKIGELLLYGVLGVNSSNSSNLDQTILNQVKNSLANGFNKVVVVHSKEEIASVVQRLADMDVIANTENSLVKVLTYTDVQGQTFDEVYSLIDEKTILQSIPEIIQGRPKRAFYNTVMYMIVSRAKSLVMLKDSTNTFNNSEVDTLNNTLAKNETDQRNTKENLAKRIADESELFGVAIKTDIKEPKPDQTSSENPPKKDETTIIVDDEPEDLSDTESDNYNEPNGKSEPFLEDNTEDLEREINYDDIVSENSLAASELAEQSNHIQRVKAPTFTGLSRAINRSLKRIVYNTITNEDGSESTEAVIVPLFQEGSDVRYVYVEEDGAKFVRIIAKETAISGNTRTINGTNKWTEIGVINQKSLETDLDPFYNDLYKRAQNKKTIPFDASLQDSAITEDNILRTGKVHYAAPETFVYGDYKKADFLAIINNFLQSSLFNEKQAYEAITKDDLIESMRTGKLSINLVLLSSKIITENPQLFSYGSKLGVPYLMIEQKTNTGKKIVKAIALQPRQLSKKDIISGEYKELFNFWEAIKKLKTFDGFPKMNTDNFTAIFDLFTRNLAVKQVTVGTRIENIVVLEPNGKTPVTREEIAPFYPNVVNLSPAQLGQLTKTINSVVADLYDTRNVLVKQSFSEHIPFLQNLLTGLKTYSKNQIPEIQKETEDLTKQIADLTKRTDEVLNNPAAVLEKIANSYQEVFKAPGMRRLMSLTLERPLIEYLLDKKGIRTPFVIRELRSLQTNSQFPFGPNSELNLDSEENIKDIFTKIRLLRRYISQGLDNFTASDILGYELKNPKPYKKNEERSNYRDVIVSKAMGVTYVYDSFSGEILEIKPPNDRNPNEQPQKKRIDKFIPNGGVIQTQWNKLAQANKSIEGVVIRKTLKKFGKGKDLEINMSMGLPLMKLRDSSTYQAGYAKALRQFINNSLTSFTDKYEAVNYFTDLIQSSTISDINKQIFIESITNYINTYVAKLRSGRLLLTSANLFSEKVLDTNGNTILDYTESFLKQTFTVTEEEIKKLQTDFLNNMLTEETFLNVFNEENIDKNGEFKNLRLPLFRMEANMDFNTGKQSFGNDLDTASQLFNNTFKTAFVRATPTTITVDVGQNFEPISTVEPVVESTPVQENKTIVEEPVKPIKRSKKKPISESSEIMPDTPDNGTDEVKKC